MAVRAIGNVRIVRDISNGDAGGEGVAIGDEQNTPAISGVDPGDERSVDDSGVIDPATIGNSGTGDAPFGYTKSGRRRNRAVGSGGSGSTKGGRKTASETTGTITSLLFSVHLMGATFLKVPELALSEDESKALGEAVVKVTELYDVPMMDEKTLAWVNLAMVASGIYGPRIVAAKINHSKKPATVVRMGVK